MKTQKQKKLFIHIRVIENVNNRIEKEIIKTLDNFSRYLFFGLPNFNTYIFNI